MTTDQFEKAFSDFLDSDICDQAENQIFSALRTAFLAGWQAAMEQKETRDEKRA